MRSFEFALLDWIQGNLRNPVMDLLMPAVTTLGNGGLIWIALAGILLLIPRYRKAGAAVLAGLALEVICCNLVLKPLIARVRPCDVNTAVQLLVAGRTISRSPPAIPVPRSLRSRRSMPAGTDCGSRLCFWRR